jgi:hypothetical protein
MEGLRILQENGRFFCSVPSTPHALPSQPPTHPSPEVLKCQKHEASHIPPYNGEAKTLELGIYLPAYFMALCLIDRNPGTNFP